MRQTYQKARAVLFDFAGTLFAPQPAQRQVELATERLGLALTADQCALLAGQLLDAGMPGGPYPEVVPAELAHAYAVRDLGSEAHRAAYVGLMSTVPAPAGLAAALYELVRHPDGWVPYSDAQDTIRALVDRDVPMGLVSNVGFDLRPILLGNGMDRLAGHATLSFEHGVAKPAAEIFRLALGLIGAEAEETLMVGDHPQADGGAAAVGMRTLILPMSAPGSRQGLDAVLELVRV
jgi:FMN phosphatase YigB (HAD superfamily)